jgi:hypothetical protein
MQYSVTASAGLFVRRTPDSNSRDNILGKAAFGALVRGLEFNADRTWMRGTVVTDQGEKTGWMSFRWLKAVEADKPLPPPTPLPPILKLDWRLGANMREFAYYGTHVMPPTADEGLRARQLTVANAIGIKVIRFWAPHHRFNTQQSIDQVGKALDVIRNFKMQAVICLEDSLTGAGFFIPGDEQFHTGPLGHLVKAYWLQERYQLHYLPFVEQMVHAFKDDPAVLMWELGNEFALHPQPAPEVKVAQSFRQFTGVATKLIKSISPTHLTGTGLVHFNHVHSPFEDRKAAARELYGIPTLDAISLHYYAHDAEYDQMRIDIEVAKSLQKPFYVGEIGMERDTGDRVAFLDREIRIKRSEGAFMIMPWNLDSAEWDANIGDIFAFSRRHWDYQAVLEKLRQLAP